MRLEESLRLSLRWIGGHRLRSALTTLGIVIGIAAVVVFVTVGASLKADVVAEIGTTSAANVYLFAVPADDRGFPDAPQPVFTEYDANRLAEIEGVGAVVPLGAAEVSAIRHRNRTLPRRQLTATTPAYFEAANVTAGRAFEQGASEVVLNREAARLFRENVTVGDRLVVIRSSGRTADATVVGIVAGSGGLLPTGGFRSTPRVFVPTDPFYDTVIESPTVGARQRVYPQVTVVAEPGETSAVRDRVRAYLDGGSDAAVLTPASYELSARTNEDFVAQVERLIDRVTSFVTAIAVISLVVGAIGIANVMLVSVTERTRQIGIMKAVGARDRDVLQLFLVEAVLLGLLGVALGLPLGLAGAYAATKYADIGFAVAPVWFGITVVVGVGVGVVSGLYPAWRAARVDPIEALRRE